MSRPLTNVRGSSCPSHGWCGGAGSTIHVNPSVRPLPYGANAAVTNLGSAENPVLEFSLPAGRPGPVTADVGSVTTVPAGQAANVINSGNTSHLVLDFELPRGADGVSPVVSIGNTATLAYGSGATVVNTGDTSNVVLEFGIPGSDETFETFSKNLRSAASTIAYANAGAIAAVTYPAANVTKTFGYDGAGRLATITLSGDTPPGIATVKTLAYDGAGALVGTSYS